MKVEWENIFIKENVTRDNYLSGGEFITFITPMVGGVPKKYTLCGSVFKFVNKSRGNKRITKTSKRS